MSGPVFTSFQFDAFAKAIRQRESSSDYSNPKNPDHLGAYQMGILSLEDAGFLVKGNWKKFSQVNEGDWSPFARSLGVNSVASFLHNPNAQDIAFQRYTQKNFTYLQNERRYIGKTIDGIPITESSLLAGAHLVGHVPLKNFLSTNGKFVPHDQFGTKVTNYLSEFSNYNFTFPSSPSAHFEFSPAVDTHPQTTHGDRVAPSTTTPEPAPAKPAPGHTTAALNMQDAYDAFFVDFGGGKQGEDALGWSPELIPDAPGQHDQMVALAEAIFGRERAQARNSPISSIFANTLANRQLDQNARPTYGPMQGSDPTVAIAAAPHQTVEPAPNQGAASQRRQGPTGRRDDPIFIYLTG